jgi:hypothetical protein
MGFESPLKITPIGRRLWTLSAPLIYTTESGFTYIVPIGRQTDLASTWGIPVVAEKFDGLVPMSATLHDMLYDGIYNGEIVSRKEADATFYEAMSWENDFYKALGQGEAISNLERHAVWEGVMLGGRSAFRGTVDGYEPAGPHYEVNTDT